MRFTYFMGIGVDMSSDAENAAGHASECNPMVFPSLSVRRLMKSYFPMENFHIIPQSP